MFEKIITHAKDAISRGDMSASIVAEKVLRYRINMNPKLTKLGEKDLISAAHEEICCGIDTLIAQSANKERR